MLKKYYIWAFMIITSTLQAAVQEAIAPERHNYPWFTIVESCPENQFICTPKIKLSACFLTCVKFEQKGTDIYVLFGNRKERLGRYTGSINDLQATIEHKKDKYKITFIPKKQVAA